MALANHRPHRFADLVRRIHVPLVVALQALGDRPFIMKIQVAQPFRSIASAHSNHDHRPRRALGSDALARHSVGYRVLLAGENVEHLVDDLAPVPIGTGAHLVEAEAFERLLHVRRPRRPRLVVSRFRVGERGEHRARARKLVVVFPQIFCKPCVIPRDGHRDLAPARLEERQRDLGLDSLGSSLRAGIREPRPPNRLDTSHAAARLLVSAQQHKGRSQKRRRQHDHDHRRHANERRPQQSGYGDPATHGAPVPLSSPALPHPQAQDLSGRKRPPRQASRASFRGRGS